MPCHGSVPQNRPIVLQDAPSPPLPSDTKAKKARAVSPHDRTTVTNLLPANRGMEKLVSVKGDWHGELANLRLHTEGRTPPNP